MNTPPSTPAGRLRLGIVVSHPTQYYSPWFRELAGQNEWAIRVFYLWDFGVAERRDRQFGRTLKWDVDLLGGYAHEFVPNQAKDPGTHHFRGLHNPELRDRLRAYAPAAVLLFGYAYRSHLQLLLRPPAPLVFRGDSHLLGHPRPTWRKRLGLRWVYSRMQAVTYVGAANREYFRTFGVPDRKLHFVPHCVDAARFSPTPQIAEAAGSLRRDLGLTGMKIVLFAGKFLPAKQPLPLLKAFLDLAPNHTALVFVGDGPELNSLQSLALTKPGLPVRFLPFANQSEMPVRYALADLFVLPSAGLYETWGLAVNEAMHMGVPCLVSDRVGCQEDLVTEGETGWVFPAPDHRALRAALGRALAALQGDTQALRLRIAARISGYTYSRATAGLAEALKTIAS